MLKMCDVGDVVYPRYRRLRIRDVGILGMLDLWDMRCSGCGMYKMWDLWDMGYSGCGMWDVGCLSGCGMLIYKMPNIVRSFLSCYSNSLNKIVQLYLIIVCIISK